LSRWHRNSTTKRTTLRPDRPVGVVSDSATVRVAVDAAGSDGGPEVAFSGVRQALSRDPELRVSLVAPEAEFHRLDQWPRELGSRVRTRAAEVVLPADVNPARALRGARDSTLWQSLQLLADGSADAMVSGGSTGALMVLARHLLGTLPGVERPALMARIPSLHRPVWMLDLGANVSVDARRLLEFAQLGNVAYRTIEGHAPGVGLLNIGTEPGKGPDQIREAARLLEASEAINYVGFVEADQVFENRVDLVVCDGFSGNVLLKSAEGAVWLMFSELRNRLRGSLAGWIVRARLRAVHDRLDPAAHNGAPLLGVRGTVIKSHGGTCARGFARALELAAIEARRNLVAELEAQLLASY